MRVSKSLAAVAVFVLALVPCTPQTKTQSQSRSTDKPSPAEEQKSLLRMDLLQLRQEGMALPQRNIFAPRAAASRPVNVVSQGGQFTAPDSPDENTPLLPGNPEATPPVMTINLRYIGFIESPRRIIALVMFEGRAVAVVEGEVLSEGVRIGKITRDAVEVFLPDSTTRAFSLEGE
jgi:hypothetical protein